MATESPSVSLNPFRRRAEGLLDLIPVLVPVACVLVVVFALASRIVRKAASFLHFDRQVQQLFAFCYASRSSSKSPA